jgi:hypothetical protein
MKFDKEEDSGYRKRRTDEDDEGVKEVLERFAAARKQG